MNEDGIKYDSSLVDRHSDAFYIGYNEGWNITDIDGSITGCTPKQSRSDYTTDVEWASYCEGVLIGRCDKLAD